MMQVLQHPQGCYMPTSAAPLASQLAPLAGGCCLVQPPPLVVTMPTVSVAQQQQLQQQQQQQHHQQHQVLTLEPALMPQHRPNVDYLPPPPPPSHSPGAGAAAALKGLSFHTPPAA